MLPKNFQVGCQILNNVTKNSLFILRFSKKVSQNNKFIDGPENKIRLTFEEYKKKLKQCPKSPFAQFYCKKLFSKSKPKCKVTTASDDYLKAQQYLKFRIKDLIRFVEDESQLITKNIKIHLDNSKVAHTNQLEELIKKTTGKLDELIKLDVSYGNWMRKETLLLNNEIKRSFDALERVIDANVKHIESMLKKLRSDVSICVKSAEKNYLITCRRHNIPFDLAKCTKEQSDKVAEMLDLMNEKAHRNFKEIAKFHERIVRTHEMMMRETIEVNIKKTAEFLRYLEKCITQLKRSSK